MAKSRKSVSKADAASDAYQEADGKEPAVTPDADIEAKTVEDAASEITSSDPDLKKNTEETASDVTPEVETSEEVSDIDKVVSDPDQTDSVEASTAETADAQASEKEVEPAEVEPERESAEQEAASLVPVPAAQPTPRRSVFWPLVFGGLVAAGLGFVAGRGDQLEPYLPASMQRAQSDLTPLEEALAEMMEVNASQTEQIEALQNRPEAPDASDEIAALGELVTSLEARLADFEARPVVVAPTVNGPGAEDVAALQEAVSGQQATLEAQRAEIAALAEKADAAEAMARSEAADLLARAALTRVVTAVETGDSFSPALSDLEEIATVEIPEALRIAAENGVPTIASLRDSFPDAARAGLSAARAEVPEAEVEGFGDFIRRQLGARSVTPREGSDPDAILSRAEAALRQGDLATALTEMEALPEASRSAMQDWLDPATARQAAEDAANSLADSLKSN